MRPPVGRGWWPVRRWDGSLVVEQSLIRRQSGHWLATHHFGPYLVWQAVGLGPIRPTGWSCQALAPIYLIPTVLLNLYWQQVPNPYLLVARRRWLKVTWVENRNLIWNWQRFGSLPSTRVYWLRCPRRNQSKWVTPLVYSQHKLDSGGGGGALGHWKICSIYGIFKQKI